MELGLENMNMEQLKGIDSNVGHGLGMFLRQNGLVQNMKKQEGGVTKAADTSVGRTKINTSGASIGANTLSKANGILTEEGLHQVSGWEQPFKGSTLKNVMSQLNQFHEAMNGEVHVNNIEAISKADEVYRELVASVANFVKEARRKIFIMHKKEAAAVLPAMSTLLIRLYSLGNAFDSKENLAYDYLMEGNLSSATVGQIMMGHGAMSTQGNMVSTGIETSQVDKTAEQMHKFGGNEQAEPDFLKELKERRLPSFGDKNAIEELKRIAMMLEDVELRAADSVVQINNDDDHRENERERIRTQFFDVTKMVHILLQNPMLMESDGATKLKKGKNVHEFHDLVNTAEFFKAVAGMTIQEATEKLDEIRQGKAETAAQDSISKSGALSEVLIDEKQGRVLRTSKDPSGKKGIKEQKAQNNFNYDEAMSRLAEVTGLGGQAGARATYYKNTEGKLQYGTNMDVAKKDPAKKVKLGFGDTEVDGQMKEERHNIFGHGSEQELAKNAGLIISSFKMQIIDYLSLHTDRHDENFFIDLEAEDPTQAFTGIDNDNVFGHGPSMTKISYEQHANEAWEKQDIEKTKGYRDVTTLLRGFEYIPKETAKQIRDLDEEKINETMKPYLDRAARFGLLKRIKNLKEYVSSDAKVVDIYTAEGMEEFKKGTLGIMAKAYLEQADDTLLGSEFSLMGSKGRTMPGILLRALAGQYFAIANTKNASKAYQTETEYMPEGTSVQDYFSNENKKTREEKFWKSFQGIIRAAGMEEDEEYKAIKEKYDAEKLKIFG